MRLIPLLLALIAAAPTASAQEGPTSSPQQQASARTDSTQPGPEDQKPASAAEPKDSDQGLPVSLDKIKDALKQPPSALTLRSLDEVPTFRVQIMERQKIEELLATLFLKSTPGPFGGYVPGGGLYGYEMQRQMFPAVDNPLRQPYSAFSGGELLTILIENLVSRDTRGRAGDA